MPVLHACTVCSQTLKNRNALSAHVLRVRKTTRRRLAEKQRRGVQITAVWVDEWAAIVDTEV